MKFKSLLLLLTAFVLLIVPNIYSQSIEIYVSDAGKYSDPPWQILQFDENGENAEVFINSNLAWPQDILFIEDQEIVLISNLNSGRITKYNSTTGAYIGNFATGIGGPTRMKIGADSLLYVLQWSGNGKVRRYKLNGSFVDDFTSVNVPQSIGIDWDRNGNLYISSYTGDNVRKFDRNGNDLGLFINSNLQGPTNIWFDATGDMLVSDYDGTAVKRFDSTGTYKSNFLTGLHHPEGVDFFPNGNILIGNGTTHSVKLFDSAGNFIEDFIPSGSGNLITPNAVVIRQNNAVSVSGSGNSILDDFLLEQNFPNPFNPTTTIKYSIPSTEFVTLKIYNILGAEVKTLVSEVGNSGGHSVNWNGTDLLGNRVSSGVYTYQLKAGDKILTNKMMVVK